MDWLWFQGFFLDVILSAVVCLSYLSFDYRFDNLQISSTWVGKPLKHSHKSCFFVGQAHLNEVWARTLLVKWRPGAEYTLQMLVSFFSFPLIGQSGNVALSSANALVHHIFTGDSSSTGHLYLHFAAGLIAIVLSSFIIWSVFFFLHKTPLCSGITWTTLWRKRYSNVLIKASEFSHGEKRVEWTSKGRATKQVKWHLLISEEGNQSYWHLNTLLCIIFGNKTKKMCGAAFAFATDLCK